MSTRGLAPRLAAAAVLLVAGALWVTPPATAILVLVGSLR
jgi:hypothetical protein